MADSCTQASFIFECANAEMALLEEAFLAAANLAGDFEPDPPGPDILAVFPPVDDVWSGLRSLFIDPAFPSFGAEIAGGNTIERPGICSVHVFCMTDFEPGATARLIQGCCRESPERAPIGSDYPRVARSRASASSVVAGT